MSCLMDRLALASGYCCIFDLLRHNRCFPTRELANRLGVHRNTVLYWERKYLNAQLAPCESCPPTLSEGRRPLVRRAGGVYKKSEEPDPDLPWHEF